ncbi:MAG: PhzF family phenazine biosynthesis protein [Mycobacteriales bacterium]
MRIFVVDAFTDRAFAGNPAGVCLVLDQPVGDAWMQQVAAEMRHAETAFLTTGAGDGADFRLRWFTPLVEVDLCGHATLAATHVLAEEGLLPAGGAPVRYATRSGVLTATAARDAAGGAVEMDFPATPVEPADAPAGLAAVLGVTPVAVGRTRFDLCVEVAGAAAVRGLRPDLAAIGRLDVRGVIVTAAADRPGVDFVSRFFAPAVGVPEDPVTGSAHCALGPYWAARLGRSALVGQQLSERGGTVAVVTKRSRVTLSGNAVTVLRGELRV